VLPPHAYYHTLDRRFVSWQPPPRTTSHIASTGAGRDIPKPAPISPIRSPVVGTGTITVADLVWSPGRPSVDMVAPPAPVVRSLHPVAMPTICDQALCASSVQPSDAVIQPLYAPASPPPPPARRSRHTQDWGQRTSTLTISPDGRPRRPELAPSVAMPGLDDNVLSLHNSGPAIGKRKHPAGSCTERVAMPRDASRGQAEEGDDVEHDGVTCHDHEKERDEQPVFVEPSMPSSSSSSNMAPVASIRVPSAVAVAALAAGRFVCTLSSQLSVCALQWVDD
jgi:hypothetical protein